MFRKAASGRDAFTFSLSGSRTIAAFGPVWVIADDLLQTDTDRQLALPLEDQPETPPELASIWRRFWPRRSQKAA